MRSYVLCLYDLCCSRRRSLTARLIISIGQNREGGMHDHVCMYLHTYIHVSVQYKYVHTYITYVCAFKRFVGEKKNFLRRAREKKKKKKEIRLPWLFFLRSHFGEWIRLYLCFCVFFCFFLFFFGGGKEEACS